MVLRPLAEKRGLDTWEKLRSFTEDEWYPSRLAFGKFKGRLFYEAGEDSNLRSWLSINTWNYFHRRAAKVAKDRKGD